MTVGQPGTLKFELPLTSPKWELLRDPYLRIRADGREFVPLNPIEEQRDGGSLMGHIELVEAQALLGRVYKTVGDTPLAVTILASAPPEPGCVAGSAKNALTKLLAGSGWTVGTVDVTGTHDLETEKLTLLENINEVQKIWGGWLVWDSINKTVSLRDDATWQNDTGFELRYRKNEKSVTKTTDWSNVVTRIYPLGEKDLNIGSVNGGVYYLENFSYTSEVREAIWRREDISNPTELKTAATAYLAKACRPRVQYKASIVDLRDLPGYDHETLSYGDIVTIQDETLANAVKIRVIGHSYDFFQPWKCSLTLGDPLQDGMSVLAQASNAGDYVQNALRPSKSLSETLKGLQTLQDHAVDSVDSSSGLTLNVYLPPTTTKVLTSLLRFKLLPFRAYSKSAASGGGQTVTISTNSSQSSAMEYYSRYEHSHVLSGSSILPTNVIIDVNSHVHGIPHSHIVSGHDHALTFGIYEDTSATGVTVTINGVNRTAALGGPFTTDQNSLEIKDYLVVGQWNTIVLGSARLGRIDAIVFTQARMTAIE